jgi:hypothetical protein
VVQNEVSAAEYWEAEWSMFLSSDKFDEELEEEAADAGGGRGAGELSVETHLKPLCMLKNRWKVSVCCRSCTASKKVRIVTVGMSGGRSLTRPLRDARRFPSTRWYLVPEASPATLRFGSCPSFKDHICRPRAKPSTPKSRFATFASV